MARNTSIALLIALLTAILVHADVPLASKAELREEATHIVIGEVQTVFSATTESNDWVDTKSVAEISVQNVEKGDRLLAGDLVYGRFWNRRWVGEGDPDPVISVDRHGHRAEEGCDRPVHVDPRPLELGGDAVQLRLGHQAVP